jgi:hypothetical protein
MFRFRAKALFDPIEARHITHWAGADSEHNANNAATANTVTTERINDLCALPILKILMLFSSRLRWSRRTQLPGAKTVRKKDQEQADTDHQRRYDGQDQGQAFETQVHEVSHD